MQQLLAATRGRQRPLIGPLLGMGVAIALLSCTRTTGLCEADNQCGPNQVCHPELHACAVQVSVVNTGDQNGTVTSNPVGIECGPKSSRCTAAFLSGTEVTLRVQPGIGSRFVGWSGACVGLTPLCKISASRQTIGAQFTPKVCNKQGWCWENPLPQGNGVNDILAISDRDAWAIGGGVDSSVLHWNGSQWLPVTDPAGKRVEQFEGVAANDIWAFGSNGTIVHWDGTSWADRSHPSTTSWKGMWANSSTDVWAVGGPASIIARWNGSVWTSYSHDGPKSPTDRLVGIYSGDRGGEVWAIGEAGFYLRYKGVDWKLLSGAMPGTLAWIDGSSVKDVWSVGAAINQWDSLSMSWKPVSAPTAVELQRVLMVSASAPWVVDTSGRAFRRVGTVWEPMLPEKTGNSISSTGPNNVWAGGAFGTLQHWDGDAWTSTSSGAVQTLQAIWGIAKDDIWVGGENGILLHWDGVAWTRFPSGTTAQIGPAGLWGSNSNDIWASTVNGQMLHYTDGVWRVVAIGHNDLLAGIWGTDQNNIWTVGNSGVIYHYDGRTWLRQSSGTTRELRCIWGSSATDIWTVGSGTLLHFVNGIWQQTQIPPGADTYFHAVWGKAHNDVWAGGKDSVIVHWNGLNWTRENTPSEPRFITEINGDLAAGFNNDGMTLKDGAIFRRSGNSWILESNFNRAVLHLWRASDNDIWAIGSGGTIFHYQK